MNITFPDTTPTINAIRGAIGRDTEWYIIASSTECPVCDLDPVTQTSVDSFCEICSGLYHIPIYSGVSISGHITWGYSEQLGWVSGGQLAEGDCRVQIGYSLDNITVVEAAQWVVVDAKKMQIKKKTLRGVPEINRILIDCIELEE